MVLEDVICLVLFYDCKGGNFWKSVSLAKQYGVIYLRSLLESLSHPILTVFSILFCCCLFYGRMNHPRVIFGR